MKSMKKALLITATLLAATLLFSGCAFHFGKVASYEDAEKTYRITFTQYGTYYLDPISFALYKESGTYEGDPTTDGEVILTVETTVLGDVSEPYTETLTITDGSFNKAVGLGGNMTFIKKD